jgi:hypothetical protein
MKVNCIFVQFNQKEKKMSFRNKMSLPTLENPSETRYLESHRQIGFPLEGKLQVYGYDLASNRYTLKSSVDVDESCDKLHPTHIGLGQECGRAAKNWSLRVYTFSKNGELEEGTFYENIMGIGFRHTNSRDLLLIKFKGQKKADRSRKIIDMATGNYIKLIDDEGEESTTFPNSPDHISGNLFGINRDVYELVGDRLIFRQSASDLPESTVINESKNLISVWTGEGSYVLKTFSFDRDAEKPITTEEVQEISGDDLKVVSPTVVLLRTGEVERGVDKFTIYAFQNGNWEEVQELQGFDPEILGYGFVLFFTNDSLNDTTLWRWNPSTAQLELTLTADVTRRTGKGREREIVTKGNIPSINNSRVLSSTLILHDEGETEEEVVPVLSDALTGKELQRFDLKGYGTSYEDLVPNPTEYRVLTDVVQSFIPCKKGVCTIPKDVTGIIARFL